MAEDEFEDIVDVEIGDFFCARSSEGAAHCTDTKERSTGVVLEGAIDLAVAESRGCALDGSGTVWCWATKLHDFEESGKAIKRFLLGQPYEKAHFIGADLFASFGIEWVEPSFCFGRDGTIVDEIVDASRGMCIRIGGRVWCDEIGPGDHEFADIVQLAAGHDFFCMRHGDGSITCRGHNRYGQLGAPPRTVMRTPTSIEFEE